MRPKDQGSYAACAIRKVSEEVSLPTEWVTLLTRIVEKYPQGHEYVEFSHYDTSRHQESRHHVAMWMIRVSSKVRAYGGSQAIPSSVWAVPLGTFRIGEAQSKQWSLQPVEECATMTSSGQQKACLGSLAWRPVLSVIENQNEFRTFKVFGEILEAQLMNPICIQKLLSLVCMHDVLQEVGHAMLFDYKSD